MARAGDYMTLDYCKALMGKYCGFLEESDIECADFRFTSISDVFGMISFIENSCILVDKDLGLKIKDVGSGDVSPQFEHTLHFVRRTTSWVTVGYPAFRITRCVDYVPVNISLTNFLEKFPELFKRDYYLIIDNSKVGEALLKGEYNYVVIEESSIGGEDFFEYLGGLHLRDKGYFVTKWNPVGGSDFFAYKIPDYAKVLQRNGVIKKGAFLSELELYPLIKQDERLVKPADSQYDIVVCEAEARYNLALRSNTGIGQKIGWMDQHHTVYGVGPTTYIPDAENIHKYFGKRAGAIIFTNTLEKVEIEPSESGFPYENYEIETVKLLIKSIFASKILSHKKDVKLSLKNYVQEIRKRSLEEILQKLP